MTSCAATFHLCVAPVEVFSEHRSRRRSPWGRLRQRGRARRKPEDAQSHATRQQCANEKKGTEQVRVEEGEEQELRKKWLSAGGLLLPLPLGSCPPKRSNSSRYCFGGACRTWAGTRTNWRPTAEFIGRFVGRPSSGGRHGAEDGPWSRQKLSVVTGSKGPWRTRQSPKTSSWLWVQFSEEPHSGPTMRSNLGDIANILNVSVL